MENWACSTCGGDNPVGTRFCGHCGAAADAPWTCASCSGENPSSTKFCGHCGAPAGTPAPAAAQPPPETEPNVAEALKSFIAPAVAERLIEGGGQLADERRLITSLFADVSGFTPLSERLDPEELVEVIDPLITALSEIVGRYAGIVDKYAGDALLALFGAPIVHEDDAERALLVALEMHRELARLKEELPHGELLGLHIGVNSGHAIARVQGSQVRLDYNVLGDAVNLAQRLESVAPLGETYVSEATYRLTKGRFEFESVGDLTLKGKSEPVPGWRLIGERAHVDARHGGLFGRDAELAVLDAALDELDRGRGSVVVLSGEAGVGKSRLTAEFQTRAADRGVRWLGTRCLSYGAALAYRPLIELLRHEPDVAAAASDEQRQFISRILGEPAPGVDGLEPEAFRRGLHQAVGAALSALGETRPLVLALEDVHWADHSSLALLADVVRLCADRPVLFYPITRPDGLPTLAAAAPDHSTIELGPLGADAVAEFIGALLEGVAPPALAKAVARRTGGNPLFVEEIVASLVETGTLARAGDGWKLQAGWDAVSLPTSIEKVLTARIDLLSRPTATVLQEASVIGRRMRNELLTAVAAAVPDVESRVSELVQKGFLDPGTDDDGAPVVSFHHALIVDAAYGRLLRRTRKEMHLRVAETGEAMYGATDSTVDLLAQHYYLGGAGEKAVPYLVRAGERAKSLFANDEAIVHLSRAVELAPENTDVTLELADLHELVGNYEQALGLYRDARDATRDVRAWRGIAATLRKRGEYREALAELEKAFAAAELEGRDLLPLWLERGWTLEASGRLLEAIEVLRGGLEVADGREDSAAAQLMFQLAVALSFHGEYDAALEHALAAQRIFETQADPRGLASTMRVLGDVYRHLGRLDEAAVALRAGVEVAERVGNVEELGGCLAGLGIVEATRGAEEEALVCFRRAVEEFDNVGHASGRANAYNNLAYMLTLSEQHDEALEHGERALELAEAVGHVPTIAAAHDTIAAIALAQGNYEDAVARGEKAAALHLEIGARPDAANALETAITACERLGDTERARSLSERARDLGVSKLA